MHCFRRTVDAGIPRVRRRVFRCKAFVDTPYHKVTIGLFMVLTSGWFYFRLFTFPSAALFPIFKAIKTQPNYSETEGSSYFVFILLTLSLMNIYWYVCRTSKVCSRRPQVVSKGTWSTSAEACDGACSDVFPLFCRFVLMVKMFVHFIVSGQMRDLHSRVSDVDATVQPRSRKSADRRPKAE